MFDTCKLSASCILLNAPSGASLPAGRRMERLPYQKILGVFAHRGLHNPSERTRCQGSENCTYPIIPARLQEEARTMGRDLRKSSIGVGLGHSLAHARALQAHTPAESRESYMIYRVMRIAIGLAKYVHCCVNPVVPILKGGLLTVPHNLLLSGNTCCYLLRAVLP